MITVTRIPGWRARLAVVLDELRRKPFAWGDNDCGYALAGRAVEAITGVDVALPYREAYTTPAGALAVLTKAGFTDLANLVATILPEIHPSQARVGDIAAIKTDTALGHGLGVVNGGGTILVLREEGIGTVSLLDADRAFRVG